MAFRLRKRIKPPQRIRLNEEIGTLCAYLASSHADFINGPSSTSIAVRPGPCR